MYGVPLMSSQVSRRLSVLLIVPPFGTGRISIVDSPLWTDGPGGAGVGRRHPGGTRCPTYLAAAAPEVSASAQASAGLFLPCSIACSVASTAVRTSLFFDPR